MGNDDVMNDITKIKIQEIRILNVEGLRDYWFSAFSEVALF